MITRSPWDTSELVRVAGRDAHPVCQCCGRDPEVVRPDELTFRRQPGPDVCVDPRDLLGDLNRAYAAE